MNIKCIALDLDRTMQVDGFLTEIIMLYVMQLKMVFTL